MSASVLSLHNLFNQAVAALQHGRPADALAASEQLLRHAPGTPEVHHVAGLALSQLGRPADAVRQLEAGLKARPGDAGMRCALAATLVSSGDLPRGIEEYRTALETQPDLLDALVGLAFAALNGGRLREAESAAQSATDRHPDSPRSWQALALAQREIGDHKAAAASFDRAAALAPADFRIALGRAQVEYERGGDSGPFYRRAQTLRPGDPQVVLGLARVALLGGDGAGARELLERQLQAAPGWLEGHRALANLRWQMGQGAASLISLDRAITAAPRSWELHSARIGLLQAMQQWQASQEAIEAARAALGDSSAHAEALAQMEFVSRDEAGDRRGAADLLEAVKLSGTSTNFQLAVVRHWLRGGSPERAADLAHKLASSTGHGAAWAYLSTAWRVLGDERWQWLHGDERFVITADLSDIAGRLDELADELRALHKTQVNPFDQSLRGGTQTDGQLFTIERPAIQALKQACHLAVEDYVRQLPPPDPAHPLLSLPRRDFRFVGSWSVRLQDGGYHISHVHPDGWISSAFYVAVPELRNADGSGCLHLGEPPAELGLDLPAIRIVRPQPARLALFPSHMWHGTRAFDRGERLTAAFDVAPIAS